MIPAAAVLVVGDDDGGLVPVLARLEGAHQIGHVLLAVQERRIAGVFVVRPQRLDKRHRRQLAASDIGIERLLVLEVVCSAWRAVGIVGVIRKRLMMKLEQRVRMPQHGGVPPAGVPGPGNTPIAESVADGGRRLRGH